MVYTLSFFSSKCSLFHNSNIFGSVLFTFYIQCVVKFKKNSGAKWLRKIVHQVGFIYKIIPKITCRLFLSSKP